DETRGRRRFPDEPALEDLVEMTERTDERPGVEERRAVAHRIACGRPVLVGVGTALGEPRLRLFVHEPLATFRAAFPLLAQEVLEVLHQLVRVELTRGKRWALLARRRIVFLLQLPHV